MAWRKGVLLLHLGDLYWEMQKYSDARRCYGEAIGLLDKDRKDYEALSERSKVLDKLAPYTDAIHLGLLAVSCPMSGGGAQCGHRPRDRRPEEEGEGGKRPIGGARGSQRQGEGQNMETNRGRMPNPAQDNNRDAVWYFYNVQAVSRVNHSLSDFGASARMPTTGSATTRPSSAALARVSTRRN